MPGIARATTIALTAFMRQKILAGVSAAGIDWVSMKEPHLLTVLGALASAHRLRIMASLQSSGRTYVSQLARDVGLSRPLLHLHLRKLQEAGLVRSRLELSKDSKSLNYFEVTEFYYEISPSTIAEAVKSLTVPDTNPADSE